jgi:hypothetical protein
MHIEHAAASSDQLDGDAVSELASQRSRQTGGLGEVASRLAVRDAHAHGQRHPTLSRGRASSSVSPRRSTRTKHTQYDGYACDACERGVVPPSRHTSLRHRHDSPRTRSAEARRTQRPGALGARTGRLTTLRLLLSSMATRVRQPFTG